MRECRVGERCLPVLILNALLIFVYAQSFAYADSRFLHTGDAGGRRILFEHLTDELMSAEQRCES